METKSNDEWMVMVRDKCGFKHGLFVSSNGSSGGLAMLWKENVKLDIHGETCKAHIHHPHAAA